MKKIIATISLLAGMSFSLTAHAATAVQYGDISPGSSLSVGRANCAPMGSTVSLTTSAGVSASFRCSEAYNSILIGTCHDGGSAKPQTLTCMCNTTGDKALDVVECAPGVAATSTAASIPAKMGAWNDPTCQAPAAGEPAMTFETASRSGFIASSGGGAISGKALGDAAPCDTTATRVLVTP